MGAHNAVVAPIRILFGHSHDQLFDFTINSGAARIATRLGPIELASYKLSVPTHDGVELHNIGHILKGFTTKAMCNFRECNPPPSQ